MHCCRTVIHESFLVNFQVYHTAQIIVQLRRVSLDVISFAAFNQRLGNISHKCLISHLSSSNINSDTSNPCINHNSNNIISVISPNINSLIRSRPVTTIEDLGSVPQLALVVAVNARRTVLRDAARSACDSKFTDFKLVSGCVLTNCNCHCLFVTDEKQTEKLMATLIVHFLLS